jgi:hypothetical protein
MIVLALFDWVTSGWNNLSFQAIAHVAEHDVVGLLGIFPTFLRFLSKNERRVATSHVGNGTTVFSEFGSTVYISEAISHQATTASVFGQSLGL